VGLVPYQVPQQWKEYRIMQNHALADEIIRYQKTPRHAGTNWQAGPTSGNGARFPIKLVVISLVAV
jgi:hypothetical protein